MKKRWFVLLSVLLILICTSVLADSAESLPDGIKQILSGDSWKNYSIGRTNYSDNLNDYGVDACCYYDQYGNSAALVLMHSDSKNILCLFEKGSSGDWKLKYKSDGIVKQGNAIPLITNETYGTFMISYLDSNREENLGITVTKENSGWAVTHVNYKDSKGKYTSIDVYDKKLVYSEEKNNWKKVTVQGVSPRAFEQFSLGSFPLTSSAGKESLSLPPDIPVTNDSYAMPQAQNIKFTSNKKCAVYSGPGKHYLRSANGKASVSTNDWIQVFGYQDDWILIQYDISSDHMRIGWIQKSALPKKASVSQLNMSNTPAYTVQQAIVTDDPLNSQQSIYTIPQGQQVTFLMKMGSWDYVSYSDGKTSFYGFVKENCVQVLPNEAQIKQTGIAYLSEHTTFTATQLNNAVISVSTGVTPAMKVTLTDNNQTYEWDLQFDISLNVTDFQQK